MCRADVDQAAQQPLARVLDHIAHQLADRAGTHRADVLIGPVDLGAPDRDDPDPVRAWARAVGVAYPDTAAGRRAVADAYEDALAARGLPTHLNPRLTTEARGA